MGGFLVTEPKEEKYLIDQMHMTYENLCGASGTGNVLLDRGLLVICDRELSNDPQGISLQKGALPGRKEK